MNGLGKRVSALLLGLALAGGGATYLSSPGVEHVAKSEGLRLVAYPDPGTRGAPWTICYGHTKGVYRGMRATRGQCERWLAEDLREAERAVQAVLRVPVRQGQYDALVSFVFNAGIGNLKSSTLLKLTNAGKWAASCAQYPRWVYANKIKLEGLAVRRYEEQAMCMKGGDYVFYPTAAQS